MKMQEQFLKGWTSFIFFALMALCLRNANAFEVEKEAIVRNKNFRPKIQKVVLTDLLSETSYDGQYFKIVDGKSDEAISFGADEETQLKAANVYYHLTIARKFFIETVKSEYVQNLPKVTVRINLKNKFHEMGHFGHDNLEPQYNNALTVPAGEGFPDRNIPAWNSEIWFRPAKKIHYKDLNMIDSSGAEFKVLLTKFRNQIHMTTLTRFLSELLLGNYTSGDTNTDAMTSIIRTAGASIILELAYRSSGLITKMLSRKWFHLDSALVPEIIYHEYSHMALSDSMVLSHSTSVNEGMADYFAGLIANSDQLATKIKDHNTFSGKKAKNKKKYRTAFEMGDYANADFVFGLLWEVRNELGAEVADDLIYKMRDKIDTNSSIRDQLLEAILQQCKDTCKSPGVDRLRLYQVFHKKGL